jgi:ubiquinone/menaquinone biosynthesis C-methylase UbiE
MSQQMDWTAYGGSAPDIYERYMVPAIFGPWAEDLVALATPQPGERVLDVACGTGIVARLVAQRLGPSGRVVGLDLNPGMLAVARRLPPPQGAPIEWREGNVSAIPLPDATFDLALCQQGLQFFPDRPAALQEIRRVLGPSGRMALSVWRPMHHSPGFAALFTTLGRFIAPEAAAIMESPFAFGSADDLRMLITGAGFRIVDLRPAAKTLRFPSPEEFVGRYVAATPLAAIVAKASDDARAALVTEVSAALKSSVDQQGLAFPIEAHLALARAYARAHV